MAWGAVGTTASAAPLPLVEAVSSGLSVGSQGENVRELQQELVDAGITVPGGADGVYGPATEQAVIDFQNSQGLPATGEVDEVTAAALDGDDAGSAGTSTGSGLALGATGPAVTTLQEQLIAGGAYLAGGADGVFGPATQRALTQFQRWNGLEPTGTLDDATAALLGLTGSTATPPASLTTTTNTPTTTNNDYVGLSLGSQGDIVKELQTALQATGLVVRGGADGVFGPATESSLKAFQRVNAFTQSGVVSARDAEILNLGSVSTATNDDTTSPTTTSAPTASPSSAYVGLTVGASGDEVRELQSALMNLGLVVLGGADGSFGNATKSALIAFQSVNGITQNGVVSERGAEILGLGTGSVSIAPPNTGTGSGAIQMEAFPVQGMCFFGDTWHAPRGGGRLHVGVDIIADQGKLLYAVADGEITKQFWDQPGALAGNGLRLTQPDGTYFIYLHMFAFAQGIELGTQVKAGDVIGFVGNTGSSATAHLHFEIHPGGGDPINPYPYMVAMDDCANTTPQYQSSFS